MTEEPYLIGLNVRTTRNYDVDAEFLQPESRRNGIGLVVSFSTSNGLYYCVEHGHDDCAWYDPSELEEL